MTLDEVRPGPAREVVATVRLDPPRAADDAKWFHAMAWQGGGSRLGRRCARSRAGTYRTAAPVPVHGDWKANVRLHVGSSILAMPLYLPATPASRRARSRRRRGSSARSSSTTRCCGARSAPAAAWLAGAAYGVLAAVALAWLAAIGAAVSRFERRAVAASV